MSSINLIRCKHCNTPVRFYAPRRAWQHVRGRNSQINDCPDPVPELQMTDDKRSYIRTSLSARNRELLSIINDIETDLEAFSHLGNNPGSNKLADLAHTLKIALDQAKSIKFTDFES